MSTQASHERVHKAATPSGCTFVGLEALIPVLLLSREDQRTQVVEAARQELQQHVLHRGWCQCSVSIFSADTCRELVAPMMLLYSFFPICMHTLPGRSSRPLGLKPHRRIKELSLCVCV